MLLRDAACGRRLAAVATVTGRCRALEELAAEVGLPLIALDPDRIRGVRTVSRSQRSLQAFGTGSVAEACALVVAGRGARLVAARTVSPDRLATCAIAEGVSP